MEEKKIAVVYKDDGPNGICGQAMSITRPWKKVFIYKSLEDAKDFIDKINDNKLTSRKNPRIEVFDEVVEM